MIYHMDHKSLTSLLKSFPNLTILVLGDFFLDRYLTVDPELAETSIETGLEAHQVVQIQNSPGAAGTVTNNLSALGVGRILTLGVIGEDGHGYDLTRGLRKMGIDTSHLIASANRYTPTYTKPICLGTEMSRLDVKNRSRTPERLESAIIDRLTELYDRADGIIVLDQVPEPDCGVVTTRVRECLAQLASRDDRPILADSRSHISAFENVILKPNEDELASLVGDTADPSAAALTLARQTKRPVLLTRGSEGIIASDGVETTRIPGISVPDPIDIVGAGDSVSASATAALAAGATLEDAALLAVLVSSITIQQLGITGTATPAQIVERYHETDLA